MAPKKKGETPPPPEPEDLEPPEPPGPTPEELLEMEAKRLAGKFLRTSSYNPPGGGEPLLPPPPERPPPLTASQELEVDASRIVARLVSAFAQMSKKRGLEEDALPTSHAPGKVLGKGLHRGQFLDWLRWEDETSDYKDMSAELKMMVIRFVRSECKDGPSCGLTGNEKDAKYSMIRDTIMSHLFRALNQDIQKEHNSRVEKLWRSPPLYAGEDTDPQREDPVTEVTDSKQLGRLMQQQDKDQMICQLIYEYELRGELDYALGLHETRLALPSVAGNSMAWYEYARFLMRTGPQQLEAEMAVRKALSLQNGSPAGPGMREVVFLALLVLNYREPCSISTEQQPLARFEVARGLLGTYAKEHPEEQGVFFFLFLAYALEARAAREEEIALAEILAREAEAAAEAARIAAEEKAARDAEEAALRAAQGIPDEEEAEAAADPASAAPSPAPSPTPDKGAKGGKDAKAADPKGSPPPAEEEAPAEEAVPEVKEPEPIVFARSELLAAQAVKFLSLAKASSDVLSAALVDLMAPTPEPVEPQEEEENPEQEAAEGEGEEAPATAPPAAAAPAPAPAPAAPPAAARKISTVKGGAPSPEPPGEDTGPFILYGPCIYQGPIPRPKHPDADPQDEGALKCMDLMLHFGVSSFIKYLVSEAAEVFSFINVHTTAKSKECQLRIIKALMLDRSWAEAVTSIADFMELCLGSKDSRHAYVLLAECHFQANQDGVVLEAPKPKKEGEEDDAADGEAKEAAGGGEGNPAEPPPAEADGGEQAADGAEGEGEGEKVPKEPIDSLAMAVSCFEKALTMPKDSHYALPYERLPLAPASRAPTPSGTAPAAQGEGSAGAEAEGAEVPAEAVATEQKPEDPARQAFQEACEQQGVEEELLIHLRLGSIHFKKAEDLSFADAEVTDRAMHHYSKSITLAPTAEAWLAVGICSYHKAPGPEAQAARKTALKETITYFSEANILDVGDPEPSAWLAVCAVETGQVQVAKQATREVLRCFDRVSLKLALRLAKTLLRHSDEAQAGPGERPALVQHCRYTSEAIAVAEACCAAEESEEAQQIVDAARKLAAQ
mmetsp:Transcript_31923/g.74720  ORF Transcript_31923/g.74720 Transcript_31923/m.74720 type:complete len:1069 (-) Transcript_31923:55-3261(-)